MDTQTGFALFNAIATTGKTLYDIAQGTSKLETKKQLMDVHDTLMSLKHEAADLEDSNRDLKERLRLKSEEFEFRNPFYYEKKYPDRPLCAKCFVGSQHVSPMAEPYRSAGVYRRCLVCDNAVQIERAHSSGFSGGSGGPNSWMG
jgi:hypothetical protein